jgi:hypothetical protein
MAEQSDRPEDGHDPARPEPDPVKKAPAKKAPAKKSNA